jgi:hypothetical protein
MELPHVHNGGTVPIEVDGVIYFTVDQSIVRGRCPYWETALAI